VQVEHGFVLSTDDMDVCWPVIIRIDDHAQAIDSIDGRHTSVYNKPKRLGKYFSPAIDHGAGHGAGLSHDVYADA
jgi:hypothetical protein